MMYSRGVGGTMTADFIGGIEENEVHLLSMEILKYSDKISEIFDAVDTKIDELSVYYKSTSFDEFQKSYNDFRKNYSIIKSNVISYSDDLLRLITKMHEGLDEVAGMYEKYAEDKKSKAKNVEYKEVL